MDSLETYGQYKSEEGKGFEPSGWKDHELIDRDVILVTERLGAPNDYDISNGNVYTMDYFYLSSLWRNLFGPRKHDIAISRLTSREKVTVDYTNLRVFIDGNEYTYDKILKSEMKKISSGEIFKQSLNKPNTHNGNIIKVEG